MAARNLLRRPKRSAGALFAVAFGIVALILAGGYIQWVYHAMRESTIRAHLGHVQIARPGFYESGKADPFRYLLPPEGAAFDKIAQMPGVLTVAPRLSLSGQQG